MKKRITTLLLALVLVVSLFAAVGCSSDTSTDSSSMTDAEREQYIQEKMVGSGKVLTESELLDNGYELSTDGETENMIKLLSTGNYSLYVDFQNADFILVDEGAGTVYSSNSLKTTNNKGGSDILQLEAYDNTNKKYNFTTSEDCVEDQTAFKIVQLNDTTIRLVFTIGNDSDKDLVPPVLSEDTYNSILSAIQSKADAETDADTKAEYEARITDVKNLYKRLDPDNLSLEDREKLQGIYPLVTVKTMYVSRNLTEKQKKLVRQAMETADFTVADLKQELIDVEYSGEARAVLFTVPVDLTLTDKGLKVNVDSSLIVSPENQKLYSIGLLPFFGAFVPTGNDDDAFMIVPDGSGSIIRANGNYTSEAYSGRIYGTDESFIRELETGRFEQALTGFFVMNRSFDGGYMSVIDKGSSMAIINASPTGSSSRAASAVASAYYQLIYKERTFSSYSVEEDTSSDSSDSSGSSSTATTVEKGVVTAKYDPTTVFEVNFLFNSADDYEEDVNGHSYSWYAVKYREYLIENGRLTSEKLSSESVTPLYIELLGAINKTESKAGIPINSIRALTSYSDAKEIANKLYENGIPGAALNLRYVYWSNGGYENTAYSRIDTLKQMGTEKELIELRDMLAGNGSKFFPSADLLYLHKGNVGNGISYSDAAARNLSSSIARVNERVLSTGALSSSTVTRKTILSPAVIAEMANSLKTSYEDLFGTEMKTISLLGMGNALNSSYKNNAVYTREDAKIEQQKALETFAGYNIIADTGNDYVWKYAKTIIDLPMGSSEYLSSTGSIPFMQIVLHGYIDYTGAAFNVEADYTNSILKAVETGAGLYFRWMGEENSVFQYTDFTNFYSLHYTDTFNEAIEAYKKVSEFCDLVRGQTITSHKTVEAYIESPYIGDIESDSIRTGTGNVFMTTFENGVQVVVNYNSYNVELGGLEDGRYTVAGNSYVYRTDEYSDWTVPSSYQTEKGGNN